MKIQREWDEGQAAQVAERAREAERARAAEQQELLGKMSRLEDFLRAHHPGLDIDLLEYRA